MDHITVPFDKETLVPEIEARFNKLKAINAELLKALTYMVQTSGPSVHYEPRQEAIRQARAAIKAATS